MKDWLNPAGDLRKSYLERLAAQKTPIFSVQAYIRMAYAFYISNDKTIDWHPLFERVAQSSLKQLYSTEWAFLLDLSFIYKREVLSREL